MSHLTMIKNKFQGLCKMIPCRMACTSVSEQCACCLYLQYSQSQHHVPQDLHLHHYCCQNLHCHRLQTPCLPSRILISLTPFSIKVLAAARPAMSAPTIITWQKFVQSSTGMLRIWQLQQFRYNVM